MACLRKHRVDGYSYSARENVKPPYSIGSTERYRRYVTAAWVTACCLLPAYAAADELPFMQSLTQPGTAYSQDIARQIARITELKDSNTHDTYAPELWEAYLELAESLSAQGNYNDALNVYNSALQVVRVTEGLDSLIQIPILQAQLKPLEEMAQWHSYDDTLHLISTISQETLSPGDDRRIEALHQLSKWELRATEEGLLDPAHETSATVELFEKEWKQIQSSDTTNVSDYGISSLLIGKAYAKLTQVRKTINKPVSEYRSYNSKPTTSGIPCQSSNRGNRGGPQSCMAASTPNLKYYLEPQDKKNREVRRHLEALRISILDVAKTLDAKTDFADRDLLVEEFRFLAESFTELVSP